jgi:hypothetical protein
MARRPRTLAELDDLIADVKAQIAAINWAYWGAQSKSSYLRRRRDKLDAERRALVAERTAPGDWET